MVICARQLYCAWAYGTVYTPRLMWDWISYDTNPIWFTVVCALYGIGFVLSAVIAIPSIIVWPAERRFFQRRASRPPLDKAIRESQEG
jgi:hypothetical protein